MYLNVGVLVGKTLNKIEIKENYGDDELYFYCDNGEIYKMYHEQNCCESVAIDDICGELDDLVGSPILIAEEVTDEGETEWGTHTWTFYKFATDKGYVTIKWYGESNGYYSESVDFVLVE